MADVEESKLVPLWEFSLVRDKFGNFVGNSSPLEIELHNMHIQADEYYWKTGDDSKRHAYRAYAGELREKGLI